MITRLEEENAFLKLEISNLTDNLKINKTLVDNLMNNSSDSLLASLSVSIKHLENNSEKLINVKDARISRLEEYLKALQTDNCGLKQNKEIECLQAEVFKLENALKEANNLQKSSNKTAFCSPSQAVIMLREENDYYKKSYKTLKTQLVELHDKIDGYENIIDNLQGELRKIRELNNNICQTSAYSQRFGGDEQSEIIFDADLKTIDEPEIGPKGNYRRALSPNANLESNYNTVLENTEASQANRRFFTPEWVGILTEAAVSPDQLIQLIKFPTLHRLLISFDFFVEAARKTDKTIEHLKMEVSAVHKRNNEMNREIVELTEKAMMYKRESEAVRKQMEVFR